MTACTGCSSPTANVSLRCDDCTLADVAASTAASGVPLKVNDERVLSHLGRVLAASSSGTAGSATREGADGRIGSAALAATGTKPAVSTSKGAA